MRLQPKFICRGSFITIIDPEIAGALKISNVIGKNKSCSADLLPYEICNVPEPRSSCITEDDHKMKILIACRISLSIAG